MCQSRTCSPLAQTTRATTIAADASSTSARSLTSDECGKTSVSSPRSAPAPNRYAIDRALMRTSKSSGRALTGDSLESAPAATRREPRERLVAFDHAPLDRIVVRAVVHQVPGLVGHI